MLFVDDDDGLHALLRALFVREQVDFDYDFVGAGGGAVSMLNAFCYDGLVLDYKLPDFLAINVAEEVRAKYPRMPIAYMTNYSGDDLMDQAARLRVHMWPTKLTLMSDTARLLRLIGGLVEEAPCEERGDFPVVQLTTPHPPPGTPERRCRTNPPLTDTGHRRRASDLGAHPVVKVPPCLDASLQTYIRRRPSLHRS